MTVEGAEPTLAQPTSGIVTRTAASGAIYAGGAVLQRGLPILMLPIFAMGLSPSEYGQIATLTAIAAIVGTCLGLGLEAAVLRFSVQLAEAPIERERFVNSVGALALALPLIGAAIAAVLLSIPLQAFGISGDVTALGLLAAAAQISTTVFVNALLRADQRVAAFAAVTVSFAAANALFTLWAVVVLRLGILGWFAASLISSAVGLAVGLALLRHRWSRHLSTQHVRKALIFSLPLLPHAVSHWVLNLSDRVLLGGMVGPAETGVYNVAYQAAAVVGLLSIAAHQGAASLYARAASDRLLRSDLRGVATFHAHLTAFLGLSAALLGPPVVLILFPAAYAGAAALIPWLAFGFVLFGLYLIPMDSLSIMVGETRWLWIATVAAATVNLVLNVTFIPAFGAGAATAATVLGYGVLLAGLVVFRLRTSGPRVEYESRRILMGLGIVGAIAIGGVAVIPPVGDVGILMRASLTAGAGIALLVIHRAPRGARESDVG